MAMTYRRFLTIFTAMLLLSLWASAAGAAVLEETPGGGDGGKLGLDVDFTYFSDGSLTVDGFCVIADGVGLQTNLEMYDGTIIYAGAKALIALEGGWLQLGGIYNYGVAFGYVGVDTMFGQTQGLAITWDGYFSSTDILSLLEVGWAWRFWEHSRFLAALKVDCSFDYGASMGSTAGYGYLRLDVDKQLGDFYLRGYGIVYVDANIEYTANFSLDYMAFSWGGVGAAVYCDGGVLSYGVNVFLSL
jgi:hypothetical protein